MSDRQSSIAAASSDLRSATSAGDAAACPSAVAGGLSQREGSGESDLGAAAAATAGHGCSRSGSRGSGGGGEAATCEVNRGSVDQRPLIDAGAVASCHVDAVPAAAARPRPDLASGREPDSKSASECGGTGRRSDGAAQAQETDIGPACVCAASRGRRKNSLPLTTAEEVTGGEYCYASHAGFFDGPPACACARADSAAGGGEAARCERWMDGASIVAHMTPFAIIGVCVQWLLDRLFGPQMAHVTDDTLTVFIDLPANMLGAFLLGLSAVALLPALLARSRHLAMAVVVGLCGSISTFATWNQRMVAIATAGFWVRAAFGFFTGSALPLLALVAGVDAGTAIRHSSLARPSAPPSLLPCTSPAAKPAPTSPPPPHRRRHMLPLLLLSAAMLLLAGLGVWLLPPSAQPWRTLALACLLAPPGTLTRFLLLRFNGKPFPLRLPFRLSCAHAPCSAPKAAERGPKGEGKGADECEWVPWGTWMANVGASVVEAAISIVYLKFPGSSSEMVVGAVQLGLLGCLSTVSMPVLEALYLHRTLRCPSKAYSYALLTIVPSFALAILIFSLPCWLLGLDPLTATQGTQP